MSKTLLDSAGLQLYDSLIKGVAGGSLSLSSDGTKLVLKSVDGKVLSQVDAPSGGGGGGSGDAIPKAGNRGTLAGFEEYPLVDFMDITLTPDSPDMCLAMSSLTIPDLDFSWLYVEDESGATFRAMTKLVIVSADTTVTLGEGWMWQNGSIPTFGNISLLICHVPPFEVGGVVFCVDLM